MMFKIYTSKKDIDFDYYVADNKTKLEIESAIFFILSVILFFAFGLNVILIIPVVLFGINFYVVFNQIKKSEENIKHQSISYKIENAMNHVFYYLDILREVMKKNGLSDDDIEKYTVSYIDQIKENKSLSELNLISEKINDHFSKITLFKIPPIVEKEYNSFLKNKLKKYYEKYYYDFSDDIKSGKFTLRPKKKHISAAASSNYLLTENLKVLGLPSTVTDINIVKNKYYALVRIYHPDHNNILTQEEAQNKMCVINEAYNYVINVLKNKDSKKGNKSINL